MIPNKALNELNRIKDKSAFNISGNYSKKKVNQYMTHYYFNDGSTLKIKHTLRIGEAHYQCQKIVKDLNINQRGI